MFAIVVLPYRFTGTIFSKTAARDGVTIEMPPVGKSRSPYASAESRTALKQACVFCRFPLHRDLSNENAFYMFRANLGPHAKIWRVAGVVERGGLENR